MSNYITSDSELQSVANAIREKSGTSEPLVYPTGFVSTIEDISGAQYDALTVADGDWGIYFWGTSDDGMKDQYRVLPGSSINVLHNSMFMVGPDDGDKLLRYSSTPSYITVNGYNISVNSAYPYKVNWNNRTKVLYYPNIMFSNGDLTITVEDTGGIE